jgi:membrane-associated phospholipid phosphatase
MHPPSSREPGQVRERVRGVLDGPAGPDDDEHVGERDLTRWDTAPGRALVRLAVWLWDRAETAWGWATPRWALLLTVVVGLAVAGLMASGAGEVYESVAEGDGMAGLDRPVLDAAVGVRNDGLDAVVTGFTHLGGKVGMPLLASAVAVGLSLRWRSWTPVVLMAVTGAGSVLMTTAGKAAVGRERPPIADAVPPFETSFAFPSGHSLNSMALAGILAYLLVRKLRRRWARVLTVVACLVFAVCMGLSRVYLGHHWLTDVVVAWALALGWVALVVTGHRLWLTMRRRGVRTGAAD